MLSNRIKSVDRGKIYIPNTVCITETTPIKHTYLNTPSSNPWIYQIKKWNFNNAPLLQQHRQ